MVALSFTADSLRAIESLAETVDRCSTELKRFPQTYKRVMIESYKAYKKEKLNPPKKIDKTSEISKYKTAKDYVHHLIAVREATRERLKRALSKARYRLKTFKPLDGRRVIETYESVFTNKYGFKDEIVLVEGYEMGKFWDLDEYEAGGEILD